MGVECDVVSGSSKSSGVRARVLIRFVMKMSRLARNDFSGFALEMSGYEAAVTYSSARQMKLSSP